MGDSRIKSSMDLTLLRVSNEGFRRVVHGNEDVVCNASRRWWGM